MESRVFILAVLAIFGQFLHWRGDGTCGNYRIDIKKNIHAKKRLLNHGILNVTIAHPFQCLTKCSEHCLCESFSICASGKRCELSQSTKEESTADYVDDTGCTYYDMERELPSQQVR